MSKTRLIVNQMAWAQFAIEVDDPTDADEVAKAIDRHLEFKRVSYEDSESYVHPDDPDDDTILFHFD